MIDTDFKENGRGGWIRTNDPLLPKQMRYQTALRPDAGIARFLADFGDAVKRLKNRAVGRADLVVKMESLAGAIVLRGLLVLP